VFAYCIGSSPAAQSLAAGRVSLIATGVRSTLELLVLLLKDVIECLGSPAGCPKVAFGVNPGTVQLEVDNPDITRLG
jgi:hypothetical protein